MAFLNRKIWRGEAYAGLHVLKDLDGPETQMKYFSDSDIKVNECKLPVTYICIVYTRQLQSHVPIEKNVTTFDGPRFRSLFIVLG